MSEDNERVDYMSLRQIATARDPSPTPVDSVARGFDASVNAIRAWAAGMYSKGTQDTMLAVARDLEINKAIILAALTDTGEEPSEATQAMVEAGVRVMGGHITDTEADTIWNAMRTAGKGPRCPTP